MIFYALLFLFLALPFGLAINPSEGVDLASVRVLILTIFLFWLADGLKEKKLNLKIDFKFALVSTFLFLSFFSICFSQEVSWSARKILFLFSIFPLYFVSRSKIDSVDKMEKAAKFLLWGGVAAAILGIFQFLSQFLWGLERVFAFWSEWVAPPFLGNNLAEAVLKNPSWLVNVSGKNYLRAVSVFPDPHMFSFYLGLLAPLSLGVFLKSKKPLYLVFFFSLLLADFLTFSRGGYAGLFAGGIFLAGFFWKSVSRKIKIALVLSGAVLVLALFAPSPVSRRFSSSFNLKEGSNQGRIEMWKKAGEVTLDNPIFGVGLGNYPLEVKPSANYRDPIYAHNTYLDISAETGVPNAVVFVLIILVSIFSSLKKAGNNPIYLGIAASLVIFASHSLFETGIYSPAVLSLFLVMLSFGDEKDI